MALPKDNLLKDTGLLGPSSIAKLMKQGVKTPAALYYWIQEDPEEVGNYLGLPRKEIVALGTLILLDHLDEKALKFWVEVSSGNLNKPISYFFKKTKFL